MGTFTSIQGKIDKLQKTVDTLLHMGEDASCICVDDLALLNKEIHEQINDLYLYHGETTEQEAALCLSLLMGYSVSMYANPEDEIKKQTIPAKAWTVPARTWYGPVSSRMTRKH